MKNWTTEAEARNKIKELVTEYYNDFKAPKKPFEKGDRISYASRVFDEKEMCALTDATLDFWLTTGRFAEEFEKKFAEWIGVKHAYLVNSGSSANLVAFMTLTAPELGERQIKRGDEVITVACGFPTTVTPILQYGAVPVFVDVTVPQYNIDVSRLESALSEKTKAVMIAHTLGNPFPLLLRIFNVDIAQITDSGVEIFPVVLLTIALFGIAIEFPAHILRFRSHIRKITI